MTVNLRNISGAPLNLGIGGRLVDTDEVIHVEGDLAKKSDQVDDAIVVSIDGELRAFPTSVWTNAGGSAKAAADVSTNEGTV